MTGLDFFAGIVNNLAVIGTREEKKLLDTLLKATSRSFYLTLRVLPARVRPQISLAYLLARTTDTIADTEIVPLGQRHEALQDLRERILGHTSAPIHLDELVRQQGSPAERALLEKVEDSLLMLKKFPETDRKLIRDVLALITGAQQMDLHRFERAAAGRVIALETAADLDDYTYRVAGCVGEFWTKLCRAHLFPKARLDDAKLLVDGVRLGKGLQLVNILRDLPADLKKGRCYLPMDKLERAGLQPGGLLLPANEKKFLPLYREHLDKAEAHLRAGWDYTNTLPFSQIRVRLACAWPILIGMRTIEKLRDLTVSELGQPVKVSRRELRKIILRSLASCPVPALWRRQLPQSGKQLLRA